MLIENSQYAQHMQLEDGHIRLVTLRQGSKQDDPIQCELSSHALHNAPPYHALSYFWGTSHNSRVISLHGSTFRVRESLYDALNHLQNGQTSQTLWVDFICIDQTNQVEIYQQISRLGEICAKAESVQVYLGEATTATDQAMDYLMRIDEGMSSRISSGGLSSLVIEGVQDILSRPWFQRAWILQDAFNARAAVLHCGYKSSSSNSIVRISRALQDKINPLSQQVLGLLPGARRDDQSVSKFQLHDLLRRFQHAKATDQRDKIYALLGLVDFSQSKSPILADYSLSQKDLMRVVIANLCFCELNSVPELSYDTIDDFLADLGVIRDEIISHVFETSVQIDLRSLLEFGSHYIKIDHSIIDAAGRNETRGKELVQTLLKEISY